MTKAVARTNEFTKRQAIVTQARLEKKNQCQFCPKILALSPGKITDFYDAMIDTSIEPQTIFDVITKWGVETSYTALRNHRSGTKGFASHMATIKKAAGRS